MDNNKRVLITTLSIIADPRRIKRIGITCKCGCKWPELVPEEIHDSNVTLEFKCKKCYTVYHLCNHKLTRQREDTYGGFDETITNKQHYDA